jgi:hypothetical protein
VTDTTLADPAPPSVLLRSALKILAWLLFLTVVGIGWYSLLSTVAPAKVDFSRGGAEIAVAFTPPFLLVLLCWAGVRRFASSPVVAAAPSVAGAPAHAVHVRLPTARFRIGAWSVLTPHGNVVKTVALIKTRKAAFRPDKAILLADGNPAHASMVGELKLERAGYQANTRLRLPRVATMLTSILDDLYSQQTRLTAAIEGAVNIYWLIPDPPLVEGTSYEDLFTAAWKRSAWRNEAHLLHILPGKKSSAYSVLSVLQNGIDESAIPYSMLITADSMLDAKELAPIIEHVFSDRSVNGFIPSEGAAGFLLFNPEWSPQDMWMHAATLAPVNMVQLDEKRQRKETLQALCSVMDASILAAGKGAGDVSIVVSDADHRGEEVVRITAAMTQVVAQLDPLEHRLSPMEYIGSFGAATDLIHLALAMEVASAESQVVCSVCSADSHVASVLIVPV